MGAEVSSCLPLGLKHRAMSSGITGKPYKGQSAGGTIWVPPETIHHTERDRQKQQLQATPVLRGLVMISTWQAAPRCLVGAMGGNGRVGLER